MPVTDNLIVVDVGGGSTEFVFGRKEVNTYLSLNMGAVHLTDHYLKTDPPTDNEVNTLNEFLEETLSAQVSIPTPQIPKPPVLVGIGGTAVNLASIKLGLAEYDPQQIHGAPLSLQEITDKIRLFRAGTINDRLMIPGLEARRADVIIAGAVIVQSILKHVGVEQIYVSTRGLRYGVMYDRFVMHNPTLSH